MKSAGSSAPSLRTTLRSRMVSTETPLRTAMRPSMMSARSRQPAALPEMRQSGPASRGDPATIGLATAPPSNRNLNDVQSLFDHDQPGRHHRAVSRGQRYVGNLAPMPGVFPDYKAPIVRN